MGNSGRQKGKDVLQLKKIDTKKPKEDKKVAGTMRGRPALSCGDDRVVGPPTRSRAVADGMFEKLVGSIVLESLVEQKHKENVNVGERNSEVHPHLLMIDVSTEEKLSLKLLLMVAMLNAFSAEDCCKRPMYAYKNGDARPPECPPDNVKCTEAPIYADEASSGKLVFNFMASMEKSSTITMIGNTTSYNVVNLVEIVHKGPGPALTLMNVKLADESFAKLNTIKVDDISIYCDGTTDLIKIEGSIPQDILDQLHKVKNETLAACKSLTTTPPSVLGAAQGSQNIDAEKDTPLYIACGVIVVLLIVSIVSTIIALKLYFCHKKDRPSASLGASEKGAQKKAETAKETSKETSQEKK
ncbi:unnamed protein product [Caenorhabditis auriculariae]|uniref:Uncharacterized protein n=1 Tax=Caenorhabditis auriculariae TaxID=2777116 RepID=A0A8S1HDX2_9PELO|nr:unnamed protein product [Caenorhabditis auriculariae]